jgi:hypothetical protein
LRVALWADLRVVLRDNGLVVGLVVMWVVKKADVMVDLLADDSAAMKVAQMADHLESQLAGEKADL